MTKIKWQTRESVTVGGHAVPIASYLGSGFGQDFGVRRHSDWSLAVKKALWPFKKLHDDVLVDGFIETDLGSLISRYQRPNDTYLEIGCGDMSLQRHLPPGAFYNALDISFSEFQLRRVLPASDSVNVAIVSATEIPVESSSVSMIISAETLTNIPDIEAALAECQRIATPDARFVCSIPNENCHKYTVKGDNSYCRHKWTYTEFIDLMARYGFRVVEGYQKGRWVPVPAWLTDISYHLPICSRDERNNVNFFYVFERI